MGALVLLILLAAMLYPALVLGLRVAPEVSLKSAAPWRLQWGPHPSPSPLSVEAATTLGPRLAAIARDGFSVAVWNPYIGGGRAGWLSSPAEGGAPLVLAAALGARTGWAWTALVAVELAVAFGAAFWVLSLLDAGGWPGAAGALAYVLSGAVASHLLGFGGSAAALGPLALVAALRPWRTLAGHAAGWFAVLLLLVPAGAQALPFLAFGALAEVFRPGTRRSLLPRAGAVLAALTLALLVWVPSFWLHRAGAEPGFLPPGPRPVAALTTVRALAVPFPEGDPASPETFAGGTSDPTARGEGFLGLGVLLLAVVGGAGALRRGEVLWLAVALFAAAAAFVPAAWLVRAGAAERPLGVLALATAILAGLGVRWLLQGVPQGWQAGVGALVCAVLLVRMVPPAAHRLPYADGPDARLASPLNEGETAGERRLAALLDTLPPDVSASLALRDVRAADLVSEPRYARLLEAGPDGELPPSRVLDSSLAELGAALILEPLPFRVVSGEIFSRIDTAPARLVDRTGDEARFEVAVPADATRLGLPAGQSTARVELVAAGERRVLSPDPTLAGESASWSWFAVPRGWPAGTATLVTASASRMEPGMAVAWDHSGLRLERESLGVRIWSWDQAQPVASLAREIIEGPAVPVRPGMVSLPPGTLAALGGVGPVEGGKAVVTGAGADTLSIAVSSPAPALLLAQVKYRPALWSATVDGMAVDTVRADEVWTGVAVGSGSHTVRLRAQLPARIWALSAAALAAGLLLALWGWRGRP